MTIREQIILDIMKISEQRQLWLLFDFLQELHAQPSNCASVLAFAGALPPHEGTQIARSLDREFNQIEGEW